LRRLKQLRASLLQVERHAQVGDDGCQFLAEVGLIASGFQLLTQGAFDLFQVA